MLFRNVVRKEDEVKWPNKKLLKQHGGISIIYFKTPCYKGLSSFLLHLPLSLAPQDHFSARLRIARPHVSLESEACWLLPSLPSLLSGVLKTGFAALFHPGEDEPPLEIVEWCEEGAFGPHCMEGLRHLYVLICHWTPPPKTIHSRLGWIPDRDFPQIHQPFGNPIPHIEQDEHHPIGSGCWLQESTGRNLQQCMLNRCIFNFVLVTSINIYLYAYQIVVHSIWHDFTMVFFWEPWPVVGVNFARACQEKVGEEPRKRAWLRVKLSQRGAHCQEGLGSDEIRRKLTAWMAQQTTMSEFPTTKADVYFWTNTILLFYYVFASLV